MCKQNRNISHAAVGQHHQTTHCKQETWTEITMVDQTEGRWKRNLRWPIYRQCIIWRRTIWLPSKLLMSNIDCASLYFHNKLFPYRWQCWYITKGVLWHSHENFFLQKETLMNLVRNMCFAFTLLKLLPRLAGANELTYCSDADHWLFFIRPGVQFLVAFSSFHFELYYIS